METNTKHQQLNLTVIQELTWEFLCNPDQCFKKEGLNLLKLCPFGLTIKNQVTCIHCRFRKTFFIFKTIARKKIVSQNTRAEQISFMLQVNSEAIVKFCFKKIEEKWGENCVSENLIQMLDTENNGSLEYLKNEKESEVSSKEIRPFRVQEPVNEQNFCINFTNFCEIDKMQMNKVYKKLDGMSHDQRLHCFIRTPANENGKEWFFAY